VLADYFYETSPELFHDDDAVSTSDDGAVAEQEPEPVLTTHLPVSL